MSLETQIEQLTTAINTLNATILTATFTAANIQPVATPKPEATQEFVHPLGYSREYADALMANEINIFTKPKPEAKAEPVIINETKADASIVSAEELKLLCLQTARAKPGNKDKIKALLLRYDAKKILDLDIKHYVEVFNLIEKGEF